MFLVMAPSSMALNGCIIIFSMASTTTPWWFVMSCHVMSCHFLSSQVIYLEQRWFRQECRLAWRPTVESSCLPWRQLLLLQPKSNSECESCWVCLLCGRMKRRRQQFQRMQLKPNTCWSRPGAAHVLKTESRKNKKKEKKMWEKMFPLNLCLIYWIL